MYSGDDRKAKKSRDFLCDVYVSYVIDLYRKVNKF